MSSEESFSPPVLTWNTRTVQRALAASCEAFGEDVRAVTTGTHRSGAVVARHAAWWLLRRHVVPTPSFPELARALGRLDHTTVLLALRRVEHRLATRPLYAAKVHEAERLLLRVPEGDDCTCRPREDAVICDEACPAHAIPMPHASACVREAMRYTDDRQTLASCELVALICERVGRGEAVSEKEWAAADRLIDTILTTIETGIAEAASR